MLIFKLTIVDETVENRLNIMIGSSYRDLDALFYWIEGYTMTWEANLKHLDSFGVVMYSTRKQQKQTG